MIWLGVLLSVGGGFGSMDGRNYSSTTSVDMVSSSSTVCKAVAQEMTRNAHDYESHPMNLDNFAPWTSNGTESSASFTIATMESMIKRHWMHSYHRRVYPKMRGLGRVKLSTSYRPYCCLCYVLDFLLRSALEVRLGYQLYSGHDTTVSLMILTFLVHTSPKFFRYNSVVVFNVFYSVFLSTAKTGPLVLNGLKWSAYNLMIPLVQIVVKFVKFNLLICFDIFLFCFLLPTSLIIWMTWSELMWIIEKHCKRPGEGQLGKAYSYNNMGDGPSEQIVSGNLGKQLGKAFSSNNMGDGPPQGKATATVNGVLPNDFYQVMARTPDKVDVNLWEHNLVIPDEICH